MKKGVSFTLTAVVVALILVVTALTVILGSGGALSNTFSFTDEGVSEQDCRQSLNRVEQGQTPPREISEECRNTVSDEEWENLKRDYEQQQIGDILTGQ